MQQILGEKVGIIDGYILKGLFLQGLPQQVRIILSTSSSESVLARARMAD